MAKAATKKKVQAVPRVPKLYPSANVSKTSAKSPGQSKRRALKFNGFPYKELPIKVLYDDLKTKLTVQGSVLSLHYHNHIIKRWNLLATATFTFDIQEEPY